MTSDNQHEHGLEVEKAAARLRTSRAEYEEREGADGHAGGRRWMLEDAEYPEAKAVAEFQPTAFPEHVWDQLLAMLRAKNPDLDESDLRESLRGYDEHDDPSPAWVAGFLQGAEAAWAEVKDKI